MEKKRVLFPDYQNQKTFSNEIYQTITFDKQVNHDLTFIDCEIKNLGFLGNQLYEKRTFEFENCKIDRVEVSGSVHHLSFVNCEIGNFFQLKDCAVSLLNFYATSNEYSIERLSFSQGRTANCIIDGYSVEYFSISNHFFANVQVLDTSNLNHLHSYASKYSLFDIFNVRQAEFYLLRDSTILFYEVEVSKVSFFKEFTNSSVTLYSTKVDNLNFEWLKCTNSFFTLENVSISETLKLVYSNLGQSQLIDCDLTNCNISIKASTLAQINSIRVNWPKGVTISDPDKKLTKERRILEEMEFWRQLKVNAIAQKNQFNALLFYTREMDVKYLSCKSLPRKGRKSKTEKVAFWLVNPIIDMFDMVFSCIRKRNAEGIMLWWHKYTSSFGIDWFRPTVIYFILSYFLFFIINEYSVSLSFKLDILKDPKFYSFLVPVKNLDGETYMKASVSLVASIFQALLIYQIIQGFRKYSFKS